MFKYLILIALVCSGCASFWGKQYEKEAKAIYQQEQKIEDMEGDAAPDVDIDVEKAKLDKMKVEHKETRGEASEEQQRNQAILAGIFNGAILLATGLFGKAT